MNANKITHADLIDILFEGKNKDYGAYELRKNYHNRISVAFIGTAFLCLLFFLTQLLANNHSPSEKPIAITELILKRLEKPTPMPELPVVKPAKQTLQKLAVIKFTKPLITSIIEPAEQPPAMEEINQNQIGLMNQDGIKGADFPAPPVEQSIGTTERLKKPEQGYEKPFTKVEKEAKFPGGMEGWKRYLERNLNSNVAADDGSPNGNYTVKVQFIVDPDGLLSDVHSIDVPAACPSCGPEAVKVIKNGPRWEPAVQNGRKVIYQAIQFVTFQVLTE